VCVRGKESEEGGLNCRILKCALQHPATPCNTLQHTATHCNARQHPATHCNTLQRTAIHCNTLQHTATHCNALQYIAKHCNTLQHTAKFGWSRPYSYANCMWMTKIQSNETKNQIVPKNGVGREGEIICTTGLRALGTSKAHQFFDF